MRRLRGWLGGSIVLVILVGLVAAWAAGAGRMTMHVGTASQPTADRAAEEGLPVDLPSRAGEKSFSCGDRKSCKPVPTIAPRAADTARHTQVLSVRVEAETRTPGS